MKFIFSSLLLVLCALFSKAQNQVGLIPQVVTNFKIGDQWKVNAKMEGRQLFIQNPYPDHLRESKFERLDAEIVATTNLDPANSIGGGYLIRRSGGAFTHRFIQQYSITQGLSWARISHRFRIDETFAKDEATQYRLRYRFGLEKALSGLELDPGEFYLKFTNEYIGILKDKSTNLEIRALGGLGYEISDSNKIEMGIDYRAENMADARTTHKTFLNVALYHSF